MAILFEGETLDLFDGNERQFWAVRASISCILNESYKPELPLCFRFMKRFLNVISVKTRQSKIKKASWLMWSVALWSQFKVNKQNKTTNSPTNFRMIHWYIEDSLCSIVKGTTVMQWCYKIILKQLFWGNLFQISYIFINTTILHWPLIL